MWSSPSYGIRCYWFFQFKGESQDKNLAKWQENAEKIRSNLRNIVIAFAERWRWSEHDTLSLPIYRRNEYVNEHKEITEKERQAMKKR